MKTITIKIRDNGNYVAINIELERTGKITTLENVFYDIIRNSLKNAFSLLCPAKEIIEVEKAFGVIIPINNEL